MRCLDGLEVVASRGMGAPVPSAASLALQVGATTSLAGVVRSSTRPRLGTAGVPPASLRVVAVEDAASQGSCQGMPRVVFAACAPTGPLRSAHGPPVTVGSNSEASARADGARVCERASAPGARLAICHVLGMVGCAQVMVAGSGAGRLAELAHRAPVRATS